MSSKKRSFDDFDDSDDDDSIDFAPSGLKTLHSRSERNRKAKIAERDKFLDKLMESGERTLIQEARLQEIHKRNSVVSSPLPSEKQEKENNTKAALDGSKSTTKKDLFRPESATIDSGKDIKATTCLGARNTLNFSIGINKTERNRVFPRWLTTEDVLKDFRTLLLMEQDKNQQQQQAQRKQDKNSLCEQLLQHATITPEACASYLTELRLCRQKLDNINRLPVPLLQWLFSLAVAPNLRKVQKNKTKEDIMGDFDPVLLSSKRGAYQTLCELWSHQIGFPQHQRYLFTLKALIDQLHHWFGSTFSSSETSGEEKDDAETSGNNKNEHVLISSSCGATLTRFFHLWALALQNDLIFCSNNQSTEVRLEEIQKNVSTAIMAVLWAGLDYSFASSSRYVGKRRKV